MKKVIPLEFKGYWKDTSNQFPAKSGIYLVYACSLNTEGNLSSIDKLVYIGEAENAKERIGNDHEKRKCWEGEVPKGKKLYFSFAPANKDDRERAEAALIFKKKPNCNDQGIDSFTYDETTVKSTGSFKFIPAEFTVKKTE